MQHKAVITYIVNWLKAYCNQAKADGFIVGISGGIDSALTSTLCALTEKKIIALSMPLHQKAEQLKLANQHIAWLKNNYGNVSSAEIDLTHSFDTLKKTLPQKTEQHLLSMANTRSRLRMLTLYAVGQSNNLLVAGTGNKVEDFGVGFFTKYGDGGVDISPIADLLKTDVFDLARELKITEQIINAVPTDGLWDAERTDEQQLGATYPELEWAMNFINNNLPETNLSERQKEVLAVYKKFNAANKHKMMPIPVCIIPKELKN
jgi:NAD+ synthase